MLRFYFLLFGAENWTTLILTLCSPLWQRFNPNLEIDNFFASSLCCNTSTFLPRSDTARMLTNCPLPWGDSIMYEAWYCGYKHHFSYLWSRHVRSPFVRADLTSKYSFSLQFHSPLHGISFHLSCRFTTLKYLLPRHDSISDRHHSCTQNVSLFGIDSWVPIYVVVVRWIPLCRIKIILQPPNRCSKSRLLIVWHFYFSYGVFFVTSLSLLLLLSWLMFFFGIFFMSPNAWKSNACLRCAHGGTANKWSIIAHVVNDKTACT